MKQRHLYQILLFSFLTMFLHKVSAQDLTKIAEELMAKDNIPEMAFAIVTKDNVLIQNVLGHHKITELNERPNANIKDFFHLGSNTKAITGFISACLVEDCKIKWDTKFFDLFSELKNQSHPDYYRITLEDLLSHRARIQPFTSGVEFQKCPEFTGNKQERRTKFAEFVLTLPPVENDNVYHYSNAGFSIAAVMLEKVSGKSWEELCIEILKEKLKIDFAFGWPNRNFENQPYGHWNDHGEIIPIPPEIEYNLSCIEPAGDLSMNIENYIKFIQLNIKGLSKENTILKSETIEYLHTARIDYAIGWGNTVTDEKQISSHAGSDGTFLVYAAIDRVKLIAYIIMLNIGSESANKGVAEMFHELKEWLKSQFSYKNVFEAVEKGTSDDVRSFPDKGTDIISKAAINKN